MGLYAIAVKRTQRSQVPADWIDQVTRITGITLVGDRSARAVRIRATEEGLREARSRLGEYLEIEPIIYHQKQE